MAQDNIVVGVDIGSTKITVVAAQGTSTGSRFDNIEILGFSEVHVPEGAVINGSVENIMQVGDAIREALGEAASRSDLDIGVVNVSFSGSHVRVSPQSDGVIRPTSSTGDEVTQKDVDQLVDDMYRAKTEANYDVLHVLPMEFVVDSSMGVRQPVGRTGIKLGGHFLIVSANNQSIQRTKKSLLEADSHLKFDKMIYAPLATSLAVLDEGEMKAGIAMVDIGDHTTDLVIYYDGIIRHIASFPVAGRHITADLRTGCGIQLGNAEKLKKEHGLAISADVPLNIEILVNFLAGRAPKQVLKKNVALIIEERLKEIAAMVYAEILKSGYEENLIGGIVLTGGTANIPEIEILFEKVTNMPVRVGLPERLAHTAKADAVSNTSYSTAIGLAWAGIKSIDPRIKSICKPPVNLSIPLREVTTQTKPKELKKVPKDDGSFWDRIIGRKDDSIGDY
ncbi:cell division protein FtsA [Dyadobacter sp. 3J3]|uniref:cell division protein FtsA n=1 Tax=Dyadobacter sp. 3J3 TaxID=2606600 RepID=UPI00135A399B|nr:cell division protein FtsA [Dyadobacter sp. 3J3]